jgi:hypothetical protein
MNRTAIIFTELYPYSALSFWLIWVYGQTEKPTPHHITLSEKSRSVEILCRVNQEGVPQLPELSTTFFSVLAQFVIPAKAGRRLPTGL